MLFLSRGKKLFYLMGVTLFGGHVVFRDNFCHIKATPTVPQNLIVGKLKMAIAMLDLSSTGLFCIGCFTAGLGAGKAKDLGPGLKQSVIIHYFMNATAKKKFKSRASPFYKGENYFKGLGVTLLGCRLNQSFSRKLQQEFND